MLGLPSPQKLRDVIDEFDKHHAEVLKRGDAAVASYKSNIFTADECRSAVDQPKPLNLTFRGANVIVAHMAANEPKHDIKARRVELGGVALLHSLRFDWLNTELNRVHISRMGLLNTLLRGRTVKRIGLRSGPNMVTLDGKDYNPGQPFLKIVPNRNHIYDWRATSRAAKTFEGERYTVDRERVLAADFFNPAQVKKISSLWDSPRTTEADKNQFLQENGGKKAEQYLRDRIELMDILLYDPDGDWQMVTLPADVNEIDDYLMQVSVDSSNEQFIWEEFYPSPGDDVEACSWGEQTMAQTLIASQLMNKIVDEAMNARRLLLVRAGTSETERKAVESSPDRSTVEVVDPQAYQDVQIGGEIPDVSNLLSLVLTWWNIQAGNPDALGGTAEGARTATEFSGLQANAQTIMEDLKKRHLEHEESVSKALAFYVLNDPGTPTNIALDIAGERVSVQYNPFRLKGSVNDFEYKIRPSSMPAQDPAVLTRRLIEFITTMMPTGAINPQAAARIVGEKAGIDDLEEIVPDPVHQFQMASALNQMEGLPPPVLPGAPGMLAGPMPGGPAPMQGGAPAKTKNTQTKPIDAARSARAAGVPR